MPILVILGLNLLVFTAVNAARILFSLYTLSLGGSAASVGAVMGGLYIFPVLLSWPVGLLSDRFAPRGLLAGSTAVGAFGMLVPCFWPVLPSLFIASALLGLTMAFIAVMGQTLIGSMSVPSDRTQNFSNYAMTGSVSIFIGPLLAGIAIDHFGYRVTSIGIALLLFFGVAAMLAWGKALPRNEAAPRSGGNLLRTLGDRSLWPLLAISSLGQLGNDIFQIFMPVYAHGAGMSATTIGVILSLLALGSFGVRLMLVRLVNRVGERHLIAVSFYIGAGAFALLPVASGAVSLAVLAFGMGVCQGCTQPLIMTLMFNGAQQGRAGEAIGLRMTTNNLSRLLGPTVFGSVAALAGLFAVFWINGLLMLAAGRLSRRGVSRS